MVIDGTGNVVVDEEATFICMVSGGNPTSGTFQWYRAGSAVDGQTAQSYSFTPALGDDGSEVECRVDNGLTASGKVTLALDSKYA